MGRLGVKNMPRRFWNCDETGLSYVVKPNKVVTAICKDSYKKDETKNNGKKWVQCSYCLQPISCQLPISERRR